MKIQNSTESLWHEAWSIWALLLYYGLWCHENTGHQSCFENASPAFFLRKRMLQEFCDDSSCRNKELDIKRSINAIIRKAMLCLNNFKSPTTNISQNYRLDTDTTCVSVESRKIYSADLGKSLTRFQLQYSNFLQFCLVMGMLDLRLIQPELTEILNCGYVVQTVWDVFY